MSSDLLKKKLQDVDEAIQRINYSFEKNKIIKEKFNRKHT